MTIHNRLILLLAIAFAFQPIAAGQSILNPIQQEKVSTADTSKVVIEPIALNNINNSSTQAFALFTKVVADKLTNNEKKSSETRVDTIIVRTIEFFSDTVGIKLESLNFRELDILGNKLLVLQNEILDLQEHIRQLLQRLQKGNIELGTNRVRWALTLKNSNPQETPAAITRRISSVISSNDSISKLLESDIDFLLTQSDKVTGLQIRLDRFNADLVSISRISSSRVFRKDMPPIWGIFSTENKIQSAKQWQLFKKHIAEDSTFLLKESTTQLILILCILILLLVLIYWLKATVHDPKLYKEKEVLNLFISEIFKNPIEVSLLIALYILWLLIPEIPPTYASVIALISVYAILRIAYDIFSKEYRKYLFGFAVAYVLFQFYGLFYDYLILGRLMLLVSQLLAIYYTIKLLNSRKIFFGEKRSSIHQITKYLGALFLIFLIIGFAGNIAGTISFSEFLTGGSIKSSFHILTTYIGFHILVSLIFLFLASPLIKDSNIIKNHSNFIFEKIFKILSVFFVLAWVFVAMDQFKIKSNVVDWGTEVLTRQNQIGETSISLFSIILFVFVIWLSIFVSKIVRHILQEEVFPRVKVERGMPGTIVMLIRISLVSIGFLLAAAAAGMELSNLAIILGAFSVGIGFGLQNIFNNLVSGLILAFERPIKEGDIVEVNTLLGTVKKIGIRSSIVRTMDGAEVIVPNGVLISNDLINWTLSDQYRRADIRIGVAYGTDPKLVIDLLLKVALENKRVNKHPAPQAFFIDFGESSLDFRLRAWVDQDFRFEVESEIRVEINLRLKEAGIEVPFPQTDLHVRSVTDDAAKKLK